VDRDSLNNDEQPEAMSQEKIDGLVHKAQQAMRDRENILLAEQAKQEWEKAWNDLYLQHVRTTIHFTREILHDFIQNQEILHEKTRDLVQETFFRADRRLLSYELQTKKTFQAWLCGIARYVCYEEIRRLLRENKLQLQRFSELLDGVEPASDDIQNEVIVLIMVRQVLKEESPESRQVFRDYLYGYKYHDIAERVDKTEEAVKMTISRIRQKLRRVCDMQRSKTVEIVPAKESKPSSQQTPDNPT
jgi:RNA polymerase sigma factor (sigma-70 family)